MKELLSTTSYVNNGTHNALSVLELGKDQYVLSTFHASHGYTSAPKHAVLTDKDLMPALAKALEHDACHPVGNAYDNIDCSISEEMFNDYTDGSWEINADPEFKEKMLAAGINPRYFGFAPLDQDVDI